MTGMEEDSENSSEYEENDEDSEQRQYTALIQSLINSGQVGIMDSHYYSTKVPPKFKPNTTILDKSEFSQLTRLSCGLGAKSSKFGIQNSHNNVYTMLSNREKGSYTYNKFPYGIKNKINNHYLPNTMTSVDNYNGKVFCGIFSNNGTKFLTASQDRQIRLYNSENDNYKLINQLRARDIGWSIIDLAFNNSNDQNFVYSTWSSSVHLCSINDNHQEPLCFISSGGGRFCIFSIVFSTDGSELLGGANDGCLYIYDCRRMGRILKIPAHEYDVNTVQFADSSCHIIYSGGDDGLIKVWDRRTLNDNLPKPVGILAGHLDGITFIDTKLDGRHLISNSKDQTIKLWDIRIFSNNDTAEKSLKAIHEQTWDYRWQQVPKKLFRSKQKLDGDTSIMTYRGHVVIKTLVRCRFSPMETTGQRYIYTGSGTGGLVIYDTLTGQIEEVVHGHVACVRDVAWHPYRNEILTSSWDGTVGRWTWTDKMHQNDENEDLHEKIHNYEVENTQQPVRRSLRIALKRINVRP